jgi:Mlc titration factor MtfA (ptsG expression regulator)
VSDALTQLAVILAAAAVLIGALFFGRATLSLIRLRPSVRFRTAPIPDGWRAIVDRDVPFARSLSTQDRERLLRLIQVFVHDKPFEGCGGLEITEEMKVTIAAHACLLLLHLEGPCYPTVDRILVYPTGFVPKYAPQYRSSGIERVPVPLKGKAWRDGVVVLSWDDVRAGASNPTDGDNVALHEFAHQLDHEDGTGGGTPVLDSPSLVRTWGRVLSAHYEQLRRDVHQGHPTVLDAYGATNPAEFFAVATETFFEKPHQLQAAEPELYEELKEYYHQDPAAGAQGGERRA